MKKIYCLILPLALSCTSVDINTLNGRLDAVEAELARQEAQVLRLNTDIQAAENVFDAMSKGTLIISCNALEDESGWCIGFSDNTSVTLRNGTDGTDGTDGQPGDDAADGSDGVSPVIGVALDSDGAYYWTLNGEWLRGTDGQLIPLTLSTTQGRPGVVPQLRIRDGIWQVSVDRAASWQNLGPVTSGTASPYIFSAVSNEEDCVRLTLNGSGQVLTMPKLLTPNLTLGGWEGVAVVPGRSVDIAWSVAHAVAGTRVSAVANSGYSVQVIASSVSEGILRVTAPSALTDAQVLVTADNGFGRICMRVIRFEKGTLMVSGLETPGSITDFDW